MEINTENVRAQMRKGVLEYCILSILAHKEAYASTIIEDLKAAELEPDNPTFLETVAQSYIRQQDYAKAIKVVERARNAGNAGNAGKPTTQTSKSQTKED